jgi:tRNA nucleotidyltransferase/poly(A) polymerase
MIIDKIIHTLCRNKFEAYFAGGAVRDMLLGIEPSDVDVVTDAQTQDIRRIFRGFKVVAAGKSFKVNFIDGIEVATYRNSASSEKPVSLQTDLRRRDLTINSMALCPYSGDLTDPFGGLNDLKNKVIRFTQNPEARIKEDPCRIIRACRFLSKIDGVFDPDSLAAMRRYRYLLKAQVAPERLRLEIMKALEYAKPSLFFNALQSVGVLADMLPALNRWVGLDGGPYHNETVFTHCMMVGDALAPQRKQLRLVGFLHDIGKAETIQTHNGRVRFIGHEKATERLMADLKTLRFTISEMAYIQSLINLHMRRIEADSTPKAVRRFLAACQKRQIDHTDHLRLAIADRKGNLAKPDYTQTQLKTICKRIRTELSGAQPSAFRLADLALTGRDVMRILKIPPGPVIGQTLEKLLVAVIDNPQLNTPEQLTAMILMKLEPRMDTNKH